jgi:phage terminase large subunit-like protein
MTVGERFEGLKKKYFYDEAAANEKIAFIEKHCRHVEGSLYGKPLILPDAFKDEILRPVFGLKKPNGKRLIQKVYIQMPRKNAKTTMMAAVEVAMLFNDGENSAQIYNCAGDDEQALLLFTAAKKMIALDPVLKKASRAYQGSVVYKDSFIKKITSKSETKHGFNTHGWIYDELHVAKNSDLHDTLDTSTGQRDNPIGWMITTPGTDKLSICYRQYSYSKNALSGAIEDDSFWCVIYESDPNADIMSEDTWRTSNPLYDLSENLRADIAKKARQAANDPQNENSFRRLNLGQWTSSETKWLKTEMWIGLGNNTINLQQFLGDMCWLGLDLSSTSDLTSLCTLFSDGEINTPFWDLWIPEAAAEEYEKKFNIPYTRWAKEGKINICDGNTIDFADVEHRILEIHENYSIRSVGYDPFNAVDLATRLEEKHYITTFKHGQGFRLSPGLKKIKEQIKSANILHNSNPVVNWTLDNVLVKENDELNIKIVKPKDEKKIDPWVSFAMATQEWMIDLPSKSVYTDRGVITI